MESTGLKHKSTSPGLDIHFSSTSSPYPAQSHAAARAGFGDEWEKPISPGKPCKMHFLSCYAVLSKMLPIIIRRCIYRCKSGEMEISPTCSYHWQHSVAWENDFSDPVIMYMTNVVHIGLSYISSLAWVNLLRYI